LIAIQASVAEFDWMIVAQAQTLPLLMIAPSLSDLAA
jgi:hypothetical protein